MRSKNQSRTKSFLPQVRYDASFLCLDELSVTDVTQDLRLSFSEAKSTVFIFSTKVTLLRSSVE